MKRDVPIPWSVSLPCVVALGALLYGWHSMATPPGAAPPSPPPQREEPPAKPKETVEPRPEPRPESRPEPQPEPSAKGEPPADAVQKVEPERVAAPPRVPTPVPTKPPATAPAEAHVPEPPPAPAPAPTPTPTPPPAADSSWPALATLRADELTAGTGDAAARSLLQLRDRLGARASDFVARTEAKSRVVVVVAADARGERGDAALATLAAFGERLVARIFVPARIDATRRPWLALVLGDAVDAPGFDGLFWGAHEAAPLAAIGELELRGALARGPELHLLPWAVAGAAGVAASATVNDALAAAEPLPSLASIMRWRMKPGARPERSEGDGEFERAATSFAAFCLARGPRDAAATGFLDLLKIDSGLLPSSDEAREGEIAARLGATRLEELEAAWRGARR